MFESKFVKVKIRDLFIPKGGSNKYTKEFIANNVGIYPVYSSNNDEIFGHCSEYLYDGEYLTWSLVGCAGYVTKLQGKFSVTNNRGILIPKDKSNYLELDYIKCLIEPLFRKYKTGREGELGKNEYTKLSPTAIDKIEEEILIPVDPNGDFDREKQKQLATLYIDIAEKKQSLIDKSRQLMGISVLLTKNSIDFFAEIKLSDVFSKIDRGKSKYTRAYCKEHLGDYPVYSADNGQPLGFMDSYDYKGKYLTISINGIAGKITVLNECFSTNADRVVCIPKDNIDISYVKFVAEPLLRNKSKGRKGDLGKNEFSKLTPKMVEQTLIPIPIKADGSFDLEKQKEFASKYEQIENIKTELKNKIDELTNIVVS